MSIKFELQRSVMGVLLDTIGLKNMTEEDFAFVEMAGEYGSRRDKDNSDFHRDEVTHIMPTTAPLVVQPAAPDLTPSNAGAVDPQPEPSVGLDRGPEPQTVEETLDTSAPQPAAPEAPPYNPADPPPDYERIATTKP